MAANIAHHQWLADEEKKSQRGKNLAYQTELLKQVEFREILKEREREEVMRELKMAREAEKLHQQRVEHALMNPDLTKTHPYRKTMITSRQ